MHVERLDASSFRQQATPFLVGHEAEHSVMLGLASRLAHDPLFYGSEPYLALALEGTQIACAAVRTPPHNLLLSVSADEAAIDAIAADVHDRFATLPGLVAPVGPGALFVELWRELTGATGRIAVSERVFRASSAIHPRDVPGQARAYRDDDWELVLSWFAAFEAEALPEAPPVDAEDALRKRLADPDSGVLLWEDGGVVSIAGHTGRTPNGMRIGPVYTPPELRGRGYASALTAELTERLLAAGHAFCFLFTDLANPTSNAMYQRVGYEPVADMNWWIFSG